MHAHPGARRPREAGALLAFPACLWCLAPGCGLQGAQHAPGLLPRRRRLPAARLHRPSAQVADVIGTFRMLSQLPNDSLGAYIISMSHTASDVLAVVLLQKEAGGEAQGGGERGGGGGLDVCVCVCVWCEGAACSVARAGMADGGRVAACTLCAPMWAAQGLAHADGAGEARLQRRLRAHERLPPHSSPLPPPCPTVQPNCPNPQ